MKFNEKLIKLRKAAGLSQEELSDKLNVARQTVSKWELGETTPEMTKLVELSDLFSVSIDDMVKETKIPEIIEKEIDHDKIDEVYNDISTAKKNLKWFYIIAGSISIITILSIVYFLLKAFLEG